MLVLKQYLLILKQYIFKVLMVHIICSGWPNLIHVLKATILEEIIDLKDMIYSDVSL